MRDVLSCLRRCGKRRGDGDVYYRHHVGLVVGAVDHPVCATAGAEPIIHGWQQPFADAVRIGQQRARDELVGGRRRNLATDGGK